MIKIKSSTIKTMIASGEYLQYPNYNSTPAFLNQKNMAMIYAKGPKKLHSYERQWAVIMN